MALIEVYHVVADMFPVDRSTNPNIIEGMVVALNSAGNAIIATGASGVRAIGLAGDSSEDTTGHTPYAADLVIGAHAPGDTANTQSTSNRVSDFFNETLASSKITVYTGGGRFLSDQIDTQTYVPGESLEVTAGGLLTNVAATNTQGVGVAVSATRAYPSGVPGTDTPDGSLSLGNFLEFILQVEHDVA
jgi:hypothetical protein